MDILDLNFDGDLVEGVRRDGTVPVRVIREGWGSSGFYSSEVLERDFKVFEGAKMFWDHPTAEQDKARPERSLNDLAGVLSNVHFKEGAVFGDAKLFSPYKDRLSELAPHIGVSILAAGKVHSGEVDGKAGNIVEAITGARSVDFVTTAGAGGKVLQLFESARESLPDEDDGTDTSDAEGVKGMDIKEAEARIAELDTAIKERDTAISESENHIAKLESEVARYREAEILTETRTLVAAQVAKSTLPELTQARLVESLSKNPPLTEDVTLDKDALAESTESAIKEEAEYLAKLTESGKVKGMGGSEHTEDEDGAKSGAKLEGAFKEMGLSDSEAKLAAQGR